MKSQKNPRTQKPHARSFFNEASSPSVYHRNARKRRNNMNRFFISEEALLAFYHKKTERETETVIE